MMKFITLLETADMLAEKLEFEDVYAGNLDASKEKTIGVYFRDEQCYRKCVGGTESYQTAKIRVIIHWTNNPTETEKQAGKLAELFENLSAAETSEHIIKFAEFKALHYIGKDEKGICEYVVDADIYYSERI